MTWEDFLQEKNLFPKNRRVEISPCFQKEGKPLAWELRAVSEAEYRRALAGKAEADPWAVLCVLSVAEPDLQDKGLWESYGTADAETTLKEMLYPGEYVKLLEEVKALNGFQERRRIWREQAKN